MLLFRHGVGREGHAAGQRFAGRNHGLAVELHQTVGVHALNRVGVRLARGELLNELAAIEVLGVNVGDDRLLAQPNRRVSLVHQRLMRNAQRHRQKVHQAVGQLGAVLREAAVAVGDADGLDAVADVGAPVLRNRRHAAHDAHQRAQCRAGAVGIVAAVDGIDQRLLEIARAVQKTQHHEAHVGRRLEPAQIGAVLHQHFAAVLPAYAACMRLADDVHAARHAAVLRNLGKADVQKRVRVVDDERGALHRGDEDGGIGALAEAVIHARVLKRQPDGLLRQRRIHARPHLGANPRAVGVLPFLVVDFAGHGRQHAVAHVGLAHAVFVPVGRDPRAPVFAQNLAVQRIRAQLIRRAQPHKLQIEIVVGQRLARLGRETVNVVQLLTALIGRSQRSADVFANPAGVNSVSQIFP